jgi:hypothetical protein
MAQTLLFTQKELNLLTQTHPDIQVGAHEVRASSERGWELRIPYQDKKNQLPQHITLVTARGSIRTFKNLDTVVDYIKEHCPHTQTFAIYFREPPKRKSTSNTNKSYKTNNKKNEINNKQTRKTK